MLKRKLIFEESVENKKMKMLESEQSTTIVTKVDVSNLTQVKNGRKLDFELTEKTAKSNILKAANRNMLELEMKQKSANLLFSAGSYLYTVIPAVKTWETKFNNKESFKAGNLTIFVTDLEHGRELNAKHLDTKIVFNVNGDKVVIHCYNTTQLLMVNGKMYTEFISQYLQPMFKKEIEDIKTDIAEYDRNVVISLGPKRPVRASRSVKSIRSIIHQPHFICKRCGYTYLTQAQLKKHKEEEHANSFNTSSSVLSIKQSTRNNSLVEEMLLSDDISINDSIKQIQMEETVNTKVIDVVESPESQELKDHKGSDHEININSCVQRDEKSINKDDLMNHKSIVHTSQSIAVPIPSQTIKCRKCGFETKDISVLDTHMIYNHGNQRNSTIIEIEDVQQNVTMDVAICIKCGFKAGNPEDLKQHNQSTHQEVRVELHQTDVITIPLSCSKCEFKCKYNIQMKKHSERVHPLLKSKSDSLKDQVIDIISEHNNELLKEILELKKTLKDVKQDLKDTKEAVIKTITENAHKSSKSEGYTKTVEIPLPEREKAELTKRYKKKKTAFLEKQKILYVGDSISLNVNFPKIESRTSTRIRTKKAYSAAFDTTAKYPHKNVVDVTKDALEDTPLDDKYSQLVIGAPSVDITNLDTSNVREKDNVEVFKQKIHVSCQNIITAAESAIRNHPELEKVVIVEHAPRFDIHEVDPTGLKPKLALFANNTLDKLQQSSDMKNKIVLGKHSLDKLHSRMYKDERTGRYDGLHMYGVNGFLLYTDSIVKIINSSQDNHDTCPQAGYQRRQKANQQGGKTIYNVPVYNTFDVLNQ